MKKEAGISMISLVVTIVVMIILAGMSITTGSKLLKQSNSESNKVFVSVLSNAIKQRRENSNIDSDKYYYVGYYISDGNVFDTIFSKKIPSTAAFEQESWYVIDSNIAKILNVNDAEDFIGSLEDGVTGKVKVALVNYNTSEVYIIEILPSDANGLVLYR